MTIIIFLIVLSVLVIAHELGHFFAAKAAKMRVDEFGLGYPPRAKHLFNWKGTEFTLNWLPFGGFVKILGENPGDEDGASRDSFASKPRDLQAMVLVAGVSANILLAWVLMSIGFMIGLPASVGSDLPVQDARIMVVQVVPDSPAEAADLRSGDIVISAARGSVVASTTPEDVTALITSSIQPVKLTLLRDHTTLEKTLTPMTGILEGHPAVGIALDSVGIAKLSFGRSILEGARSTWSIAGQTASGLFGFLKNIFTGHADFSQVAGPVGLVGLVGQAERLGFSYLLSFTALISINLAVLNLLPIPALDGGRLLFVIIEAIIRRPVSPKVFNAVNNVGFALLLLLMLIITVRDVIHLF